MCSFFKMLPYRRNYARSNYSRAATASRVKAARYMQRRMYRSAATTRNSLAARASRIMAVSAPRNSAELKSVDTVNGAATVTQAINTTGTLTAVNLIEAGSGFNNRVGRRVEMKSLHLTGLIQPTGTGQIATDIGRIMVIYDRQPNGALPAISNILRQYDQSSTSYTTALSGINPDQRERYLVLMDERVVLPAVNTSGFTGAVDGVNKTFNINRYIKMANLKTHYSADSAPAVIGDIATGAVYILTLGSIASPNEGWKFTASWRLRYTDN